MFTAIRTRKNHHIRVMALFHFGNFGLTYFLTSRLLSFNANGIRKNHRLGYLRVININGCLVRWFGQSMALVNVFLLLLIEF